VSANTTFYTDPDDEFSPRGYVNSDKAWAVVDTPGLHIVASGADGIASMQRLIEALQSAVAQARQAEQDEQLADLAESGAVA
jgi:hypothetical protein